MEQKEIYDKLASMVTEGMEKVHTSYMSVMEKNTDVGIVRDYAMAMAGFSTLLTSLGILKPTPPNLMGFGLGMVSNEKN